MNLLFIAASIGGVLGGAVEAEKLKSSIASPWPASAASFMDQMSQRAAPGGQLVIEWLTMARLTRLEDAVPSMVRGAVAAGSDGKLTSRPGSAAVMLVEKP